MDSIAGGSGILLFISLIVLSTLFKLLIGFVLYVLYGASLSKIAMKEGHDKGWLAWVPIVNIIVLPMLVEDDVSELIQGRFKLIFGTTFIISYILSSLVTVMWMLPFALTLYSFYFIAKRYSDNEVAHTIVATITFGVAIPLQLFRFRNRTPIYSAN